MAGCPVRSDVYVFLATILLFLGGMLWILKDLTTRTFADLRAENAKLKEDLQHKETNLGDTHAK